MTTTASAMPPPAMREVDLESPWVGLRSFDESLRSYFFGRDAEVQDLFERVEHRPLTILFGQSGLGKTSIVQAALVPRLRDTGFLPVSLRLRYEVESPPPERQILDALRNALRAAGRDDLAGFPAEIDGLWVLFHDPSYGFAASPAAPPVPVFILDQFEEVFTLGSRRRHALDGVRDTLATLVENRPPAALKDRLLKDEALADRLNYQVRPGKTLLCLRDDFLHLLERWRRQLPSLMENRVELRMLSGPQALQAVVEPGRLRRGKLPIVSADVGTAIVRFVSKVPFDTPLVEIETVPPLLSLICAELNDRRRAAGAEAIEAGQLQGQAEDILKSYYEGSFAGRPPAVQRLVEGRLLSDEGYRQSVALDTARSALERAGLTRPDADSTIDGLVDRRLVVIEERGSVRYLELTHDILTDVVKASRAAREAAEAEAARLQEAEREAREAAARASAAEAARAEEERRRIEGDALRATAERARKRASRFAVGALLSTAIAGSIALIAYRVSVSLAEQEKATQKKLEELLVERGRQALSAGDAQSAAVYLGAAYTGEQEDDAALRYMLGVALKRVSGRRGSFEGHADLINKVVVSPDGKWVASASADGTAKLWDAATGALNRSFDDHADVVTALAFDPAGRFLVTGGRDGSVKVRAVDGGATVAVLQNKETQVAPSQSQVGQGAAAPKQAVAEGAAQAPDKLTGGAEAGSDAASKPVTPKDVLAGPRKTLTSSNVHSARITDIAVSSNGRVATAGEDNQIVVWDFRSDFTWRWKHDGWVNRVRFASDGRTLVSAGNDGRARLWSIDEDRTIADVPHPGASILEVAVDLDRHVLTIVADDGAIESWDFLSKSKLRVTRDPSGAIERVAFAPRSPRLVTLGRDGMIRLWNTASVALERELRLAPITFSALDESGTELSASAAAGGGIAAIDVDPDGRLVVAGANDGTVRVWNAEHRSVLAAYRAHAAPITAVALMPGGHFITGGGDGTMWSWSATVDSDRTIHSDQGPLLDAAFDPPGGSIATASRDGTVVLWDAAGGTRRATLSHSPAAAWVRHVDFTKDGSRLASFGGAFAKIWDARTGASRCEYDAPAPYQVSTGAFAPDGRLIVALVSPASRSWSGGSTSAADAVPKSWVVLDEGCKQVAASLQASDGISRLVVSPSGAQLVTLSASGMALWSTSTGQRLHGPYPSSAVAFASDNDILVGSDDGQVILADRNMGWSWKRKRHQRAVTTIALGPDATIGASSTLDGTTRLWDVRTGELRAALDMAQDGLERHATDVVDTIAFSPDGRLLLSAHHDGNVRMWDVRDGRLLDSFAAHAGAIRLARFAHGDNEIVTIGEDGLIAIWAIGERRSRTAVASEILRRTHFQQGRFEAMEPALREALRSVQMTALYDGVDDAARERRIEAADAFADGQRALVDQKPRRAVAALARAFREAQQDPLARWLFGLALRPFDGVASTLIANGSRMNAIHFNRGGTMIAAAGWDGSVTIFDGGTGSLLRTLAVSTDYVSDVRFDPSGSRIVSDPVEGFASVWSAETGSKEFEIENERQVSCGSATFRPPDGRELAIKCSGGRLRTYDVERRILLREMPVGIRGTIRYSNSGSAIAVCGEGTDGADPVQVWDAESATKRASLPLPATQIGQTDCKALAFAPDDRTLVIAASDGTIRIWDFANSPRVLDRHDETIQFLAFSPDGVQLLAGDDRGSTKLWNVASGVADHVFRGAEGTSVIDGRFSPSGDRILTSEGGKVRVRDRSSGALLASLEGHDVPWVAFDIAPDGRRVVTGGRDGVGYLWDLGKMPAPMPRFEHDSPIRFAALTGDGLKLATATEAGTLTVWDASSGKKLAERAEGAGVRRLHWEPDGQTVDVLHEDGRLVGWRWNYGSVDERATGGAVSVVDSDGSLIALARRGSISLWNFDAPWQAEPNTRAVDGMVVSLAVSATAERVVAVEENGSATLLGIGDDTQATLAFAGDGVILAAFSPDGRHVATADDHRVIRLWDARTGALQIELRGHRSHVRTFAFDDSGKRMLSVGNDGAVRVWSLEDGKLVGSFGGDDRHVHLAAFSPHGRGIITANSDASVELWDEQGHPLAVFTEHAGTIGSLLVSKSGDRVITAATDGTAIAWKFRPDEMPPSAVSNAVARLRLDRADERDAR